MNEKEYQNIIYAANIQRGDIIEVSSDFPSIFFYCKKRGFRFDANMFIDILSKTIGADGTILVRSFNWDFCKGAEYNIRKTPSQVGELGNVCLKRNDFTRTKHPIYSWMVKGKHKVELCNMDNTCSFGKESPWDFFEKESAKMIIFGNTQALGLTGLHHIEQELQMNYRYEKQFNSLYTDNDGYTDKRTYSMYVRKLDRQVLFEDEEVHNRLIRTGLMEENVLDNYLKVASIEYNALFEKIRFDLSHGNIDDWVLVKPLEE